jgi:glycerol-3-phosphate dehydrogenase (NAD(P)+)
MPQHALPPITVLGAGSWGTALAIHLAKHHQTVRLWDANVQRVELMRQTRCNTQYLPDFKLPDNIELLNDLSAALKGVQDILYVLPSHACREVLMICQSYVSANARFICASKGLDSHSCQLLSQVTQEVLGDIPFAVLSGPSFAKEVARGLPTAVVIASSQLDFLNDIVMRFHQGAFRVYKSDDVIGVQVSGALKNVYAIAAGASDGLGFGANARCALITRSLAEMMRLGKAMGASSKTFMGLSGLGDLILTCTDDQSRNRRFGLAVGQGKSIVEAEQQIRQVIEGKTTAKYAMTLAKRYKVNMPIVEQVFSVLEGKCSPQQALQSLLARDAGSEF